MSFQWEERHWGRTEHGPGVGQSKGFALHQTLPGGVPQGVPPARAATPAREPLPPFSDLVDIECQDCGGRGYDPGALNPREPESCPSCNGSGRETVLRNYLAEAFRIAADPETELQLERAHLVALTAYARHTVSVLMMSLPEVA